MTKSELIDHIATHAGLTKADAGRALEALLQTITASLKDGTAITLVGFGSFDIKARAERSGRNPQTGESITIPAAKIPAFKAGKTLKDAIQS